MLLRVLLFVVAQRKIIIFTKHHVVLVALASWPSWSGYACTRARWPRHSSGPRSARAALRPWRTRWPGCACWAALGATPAAAVASAPARVMVLGFFKSFHPTEVAGGMAEHALDFFINGMRFSRFVVTHMLPSLSWLLYAFPRGFRHKKTSPIKDQAGLVFCEL